MKTKPFTKLAILLAVWFTLAIGPVFPQTIKALTLPGSLRKQELPKGSIYLQSDALIVKKDTANGLKRIRLLISNETIREREIQIMMPEDSDDVPALVSGTYEVFLTTSELMLTRTSNGQQLMFRLGSDDLSPDSRADPEPDTRPIHAIGFATYFKDCPAPSPE